MMKFLCILLLFCLPVYASTLDEDYEQMRPLMDMLSIKSGASVNLLKPYAEQGNAVAAYLLGAIYEEGRVVTKDNKKAYEFYASAAQKNPRAALKQADLLLFGDDITHDIEQAQKIYERLADDATVGHEARQKLETVKKVVDDAIFLQDSEDKALMGDKDAQLTMFEYTLARNNYVGAYVWCSIMLQNATSDDEKEELEEALEYIQGQMPLAHITRAEHELAGIQQMITLKKKK